MSALPLQTVRPSVVGGAALALVLFVPMVIVCLILACIGALAESAYE